MSRALPWGMPSAMSNSTTSPNSLRPMRWASVPPIWPAPINAILLRSMWGNVLAYGQKCGYARVLARSEGAFKSRGGEKQAVAAAALSRSMSVYHRGGRRTRRRLGATLALDPFAQPLEHHVEHRDEENPEDRRRQHAAEYRGADTAAAEHPGAGRNHQRDQAGNEGKARHHHRAEPLAGA